jgi:prepilin-type N-terminal cleavage/methylation domain-containing protein
VKPRAYATIVAQASSLPAGFTIVEVLAAMAVLAVGLAAVMAMVLGSTRVSATAAKRNVAAVLISEAVADIESRHLITSNAYNPASDIGLLVETLASPNPNTHDPRSFQNLFPPGTFAGKAVWDAYCAPPYLLNVPPPSIMPPPDCVHTLMWPLPQPPGQPLRVQTLRVNGTMATVYYADPKFFGGPLVQAANQLDNPLPSGTAYRAIYRLERHPEWHPHTVDLATGLVTYSGEFASSPFAGIYVLTLTLYADPSMKGLRLEQISDPVVVYLRDRKPR